LSFKWSRDARRHQEDSLLRGRRLLVALGSLTIVLSAPASLVPTATSASGATSATTPPPAFSFGAAGDMGGSNDAAATLAAIGRSGTEFFLHVGDMSYDEIKPESAWCDFAKSNLNSTTPYEIVAGEHDGGGKYSDGNQLITDFAACMPDRMGSTGTYGKQYYFDYPAAAPLARVIMISPGLSLYAPSNFPSYGKGTPSYQWVADAIDSAHAAGTPWVIVGMAFDCITAGEKVCEVGRDLFNMLVDKRVDLILQGHEHGYERSKQLALGPGCPALAVGSFNPACLASNGAGAAYPKAAGTVVVVSGTAGITLRPMNPNDPEAPYFDTLMGANINPGKGFMKFSVTSSRLSAVFVPSVPTAFADAFAISADASGDDTTGAYNAAPVVDPTVGPPGTAPMAPTAPARSEASPPATMTAATASPTTARPPSHDRPVVPGGATSTTSTTTRTAPATAMSTATTSGPTEPIPPSTADLHGTAMSAAPQPAKPTGTPAAVAATVALALIGAGTVRRSTRSSRSWPRHSDRGVDPCGRDENLAAQRWLVLTTLVLSIPIAGAMRPRRLHLGPSITRCASPDADGSRRGVSGGQRV
jgi:Calcineurin-like phosphoesterase